MDLETEDLGSYAVWPLTSTGIPSEVGRKRSPRAGASGQPFLGQQHWPWPGAPPWGLRKYFEAALPASCEDTLGLLIHPQISATGSSHASVLRKILAFPVAASTRFVTQETWGLALSLPPSSCSESLGLWIHFLCVLPSLLDGSGASFRPGLCQLPVVTLLHSA